MMKLLYIAVTVSWGRVEADNLVRCLLNRHYHRRRPLGAALWLSMTDLIGKDDRAATTSAPILHICAVVSEYQREDACSFKQNFFDECN